jgi:hypothetical protein
MSLKLNALLDCVATMEPEYNGGLSNHLPMALVALQRMGAPDARLDAYYAFYAPRLGVLDTKQEESQDFQWPDVIGNLDKFRLVRHYFLTQLMSEGREKVLKDVLPTLFKGVGAAAFHGLIRTAYALQVQHDGELAAALSYWTCRFLPLTESEPKSGEMAVGEWIKPFLSITAPSEDSGLIFEKMRVTASSKHFSQLLNGLSVDESTLSCLSRYASELYLKQKNFTVLHLITGTHAARLLMPWISDQESAIRYFAVAYAAGLATASINSDAANSPPTEELEWNEIISRAIKDQNDHVIKLVYSCVHEATYYGSPVYRAVANLAVLKQN